MIIAAESGFYVVTLVGGHVFKQHIIAWEVHDHVEAITPVDRASVIELDIVGPDGLMLNGQPLEQWVEVERARWAYKSSIAAE